LDDKDTDIRTEAREYFEVEKQFEDNPQCMKAEVEAEILRRI